MSVLREEKKELAIRRIKKIKRYLVSDIAL